MKVQTLTSIDAELKRKAKEAGLNVSALTEDAIKEKLGEKVVQANETLTCAFCGNPGEKETLEDVRMSEKKAKESGVEHSFIPTAYGEKTALTWLCPEEKWRCNRCLNQKIKSVSIAQT